MDLFSSTNINWNEPQSAVGDSFNSINKFLREIETKGQKIFFSADFIITKYIIMSLYEDDARIQLLISRVDLNEHD
jgi:hypothetical protein